MKKSLISFLFWGFLFFNAFSQQQDTLSTEDILKMSFTDLLNVQVVSASKTNQSLKDVAATVHVITAEQIRDRAYFTLEEALSDLPGLQFRNILGFNSYVFMRGAPSQNNLILLLVDGIQINELNSGGFYGGGQYILSDVEQIEVVYGPASALYGTNAVSGIINIITKKPKDNSGHVSLLGGNFNTGMLDFSIKNYQPEKEFGFSISGQYKTFEKADLRGTNGDNNWTNEMENFENDMSFSGRIKIKKFTSGIDFMEKRSSMTTNFKSVDDIYQDRNSLWNIAFLNAFLKYTNELHEKWSLHSTAYYRNATVRPNTINTIIKATDTTAGMQIGFFRPNHLMGIENQFNFRPSDNLLLMGGLICETEALADGFSITNSTSQDTPPPLPPKPDILNNSLISYYAQLHYRFSKTLSFNGGIRHDFSSYYGQVFIPRLGLVFNHQRLTLKALYNKAFRSPKPWDYNYGTGNINLESEKMRSLEFSLSYQFKDYLNIGGSVYFNMIKDKLTKETTPEIDRWVNKDNLNTVGFEFFGNYFVNNFNIYLNYTYNNSLDQDDVFIPEISLHSANGGFSYSLRNDFQLSLRANYIGNRKNPSIIMSTGNNEIDEAFILNGNLNYSGIRNFILQLKVNNLLNQEYYHPSNRFDGRYRQAQRTFLLKMIYNFKLTNER